MNCKTCKKQLPSKRVQLGYNLCTSCSTTEQYGMVNVIVHKTGNSVQPLPKSQADAINKIGDRKRFGTILKGGSKTSTYNPKNTKYGCSTSFVGSEAMFAKIGEEAMHLLNIRGMCAVEKLIDKSLRNFDINLKQANQLRTIFNTLQTTKTI